ncbi:MAG: nicotinate phosphoribosyltransferase [Acidobacteria bacterium]|nr:nicotinate phosphoribosyltransferase [Acidobacteriota bacterium]
MQSLALTTDLYELTMMAGYYTAGLVAPATFELYVRELPPNRSFLVAAGLEQALDYLEHLRFTSDDIAHLRELPALQGVRRDFFDDYLPRFRFTGEVWAVPEGVPLFPPAPLLRVTAPMPEAQLVETALLALVAFQTSVASRAARMVEAAAGRSVVEFGARRAHGLEAAVLAARAAYIAGCESTSNVEAGRRFGIPVSGTMAHSWVTAFPTEEEAFHQFAEVFGERTVVLLDTYDTVAAARSVAASGMKPAAVRLDSGDVVALSREVRAILDGAGLQATRIFASGDLDEWRIAAILAAGAPIDGFGVGAALSTASDAPSLGAVYKLVEIERGGASVPVMKRSPGKATHPGRKQVWRRFGRDIAAEDVIELADASVPDAPPGRHEPLLVPVMRAGRRDQQVRPTAELRARSLTEVARLPRDVRRLAEAAPYPVRIGPALQRAIDALR